jgi:hypothetical protein
MDVLTTILTCSLYASDDALVRAIAEGPGMGNTYLVVNVTGEATPADAPPPPKSEKEAVARAQGLIGEHGRPLLGLLQLPPAWLDAFGQPLGGAFDPCTNIAIGTAMLSQFDWECAPVRAPASGSRPQAALERTNRRACVLRKYEAALGAADFAEAVQLELSAQSPLAAHITDAPIFAPVPARHWGPDQLLVHLVATSAATAPPPRP